MKITDEKLSRISLITALIGIIRLIMFTPSIEVKKVDIKDITRSMIDEKVAIRSIITDISQSSSKTNYFLTISDGESQITLIIFEKQVSEISSRNLDIEDFKNKKVEVVGTITEYKSDLELILSSGDSLRIVN